MTRAKERLYLTSAEDMGGKRKWKVSQFVLEALDLPKDAARPFRAQAIEGLRRQAPAPELAGRGLAADPGRRAARGEPPAGGRLPDLPAQVPVHPHPAHPAAPAPLGGLRQRAAQGGRVLPAPAGGGQLHLARGLPAGLRRRLAQRGLPHPRPRGAAQAGGHRGADALLSRGGSLGAEAHRRGAGVRLHARPRRGCAGASTGWTRRRRASSSSTTSRATSPTRRRPIGARRRACSSRCTRWPSTRRRAACPRAWSCASSSPAWSAVTCPPRPTWRRPARPSRTRRGHPRRELRGDARVPDLPLLRVQSDLPEHRHPGVNPIPSPRGEGRRGDHEAQRQRHRHQLRDRGRGPGGDVQPLAGLQPLHVGRAGARAQEPLPRPALRHARTRADQRARRRLHRSTSSRTT